MRVTIDRAGRIVIPIAMRRSMGLAEGGEVEMVEGDGVIEIRPSTADVEIVETAEGPVARYTADEARPDTHDKDDGGVTHDAAITDEMIRETLERVRR